MAKPVLRARLCDMLGIEYPIISAGMGPTLIGETTGAPVELGIIHEIKPAKIVLEEMVAEAADILGRRLPESVQLK